MSNRDELLDKAIAEAKECEDWQLVEWLRMARGGESAARWYTDKLREAHREERKLLDENAKLRELLSKVYGYYVSGTLTPCDFCDKYCCEGDASTTCKSDEYDPDGIVVKEVERRMRELGIEVDK